MTDLSRPHITRLRVKNFRSLADIDIKLGALNVFVGKNGSGKSSIIDVLRFVRDAITRGLDAAILDRGGMNAIRRWSAKGRPYDVTIQVNVQQELVSSMTPYDILVWNGEYSFTIESVSRGDYRIKWEQFILQIDSIPPTVLEINQGQWTVWPSNFNPQSTARNELILHVPLLSNVLYTASKFPKSNNGSVIFGSETFNLLAELSFYSIYPNTLRQIQKPAHSYPLNEDGDNLASVLRELKRNKETGFAESLRNALERVVEGVHDYSVKQVGGYLVTNLHHTLPEVGRQGPAFELAQESDGTLRMLGILTALYQEPPRALVTVEEPEITIHPGALGVLCDVLQEASTRSQVLITTHNPDLIDRFPADALHVVEKVAGITHIGPVSATQREAVAQRLFSPGELMRIEGLRSDAQALVAER